MLKIRLTQTGKKDQKSYRIVVTERRSKRDGKYIANLGHYSPLTKPSTVLIDTKLYDEWIQKGAQPTSVVRNLRAKLNK